jgi:hypothetical protein
VGSQQHAAHTLDQWTLKPYTDQGTCQDGMVYMFWVTLVDNFQILIAFLLLHANLILFCIPEYNRLADGISEDEANLIFNNASWKVIKDAFKHARCISIASYYT